MSEKYVPGSEMDHSPAELQVFEQDIEEWSWKLLSLTWPSKDDLNTTIKMQS